jgi:hypothetical protein
MSGRSIASQRPWQIVRSGRKDATASCPFGGADVISELLQRAQSHEFTADGLRVLFTADGETLTMIARVVNAERLCCRFHHESRS